MQITKPFQTIGLAKETESPENPNALEKRVALFPDEVARLIDYGVEVFVEHGAGEGIGIPDEAYADEGAVLQAHDALYQNKDLIVKFKNIATEDVDLLTPKTTLFCMAHFHSFPERAQKLKARQITTIAMEEILECPKTLSDDAILGKVAMQSTLDELPVAATSLSIIFVGLHPRLYGAIRRAGNRGPMRMSVINPNHDHSHLPQLDQHTLCVYDSSKDIPGSEGFIEHAKAEGCHVLDLTQFERDRGHQLVDAYRETHPPLHFGGRRIECLHETGQAGARYGLKLLTEELQTLSTVDACRAVVLGYGNVGMGAIDECYQKGVPLIDVLSKETTCPGVIEPFLREADLIINGALLPLQQRGKTFLITSEHSAQDIRDGSVVIDLVGGSPTNRSAVEDVLSCTFLTEPAFTKNGVTFSALWGWPMLDMMKESAEKYSQSIASVLLDDEKLIRGLSFLTPGVERAVVSGPYY